MKSLISSTAPASGDRRISSFSKAFMRETSVIRNSSARNDLHVNKNAEGVPSPSSPQPAWFVNLYPIPKRIAHKKSLPRHRPSPIRLHPRRNEPLTQLRQVHAFNPKMPHPIRACVLFIH